MQIRNDENADGGRPNAAAGRGKKMYHTISETCAMTGVEPHVLRYWEKEFSLLRPKKNSGGRRAYTEKDIEAILRIKRMLEEEKYTLREAKSKLSDERRDRRIGGNAVVKKRGEIGATEGKGGAASTNVSAPEPAAVSMPVSTEASAELTEREIVHSDGNTGRGINDGGSDRSLILNIRNELLGVLGLLDRAP